MGYDLVVKDLLHHGADVYAKDYSAMPSVQLAETKGQDQMLEQLLSHHLDEERR